MTLNLQSLPLTAASLTTHNMSIWRAAVDGILRRYNDEYQREEAGAAAVILLQAMSTMGVFNHVTVIPAPQSAPLLKGGTLNKPGDTFTPAKDGQRPAMTRTLEQEISDKLAAHRNTLGYVEPDTQVSPVRSGGIGTPSGGVGSHNDPTT